MARPDTQMFRSFTTTTLTRFLKMTLARRSKTELLRFLHFLDTIPEGKYDHRYAEGKWSIKELLQHIIDGERVFDYRALRFARKDATPFRDLMRTYLPKMPKVENRKWEDLVEEFKAVRRWH